MNTTIQRPGAARTLPHDLHILDCPACAGHCYQPTATGVETCPECSGGGYATVSGDLGPTHTYTKGRPFTFDPGHRILTVQRGKKIDGYRIAEFKPDDATPGARQRAFVCKRMTGERMGEVYHLLATGDRVACDCAASTYESAHRANHRAQQAGKRTYGTTGCIHCDAIQLLLRAGLLDTGTESDGVK